jgi:hypothetical protein
VLILVALPSLMLRLVASPSGIPSGSLQGMSLDNLLDGHLSMYELSSTRQTTFSERLAQRRKHSGGKHRRRQPCQWPQKVKKRDHQSSNNGCQSPKPILLVVLERGPQSDGIQMQGCSCRQGIPDQDPPRSVVSQAG